VTTTTASTTLSSGQGTTLLIVVIGGVLLAGLVVILGRHLLGQGPDGAQSLVRSWLAVSLVFGLLAFCAAAFWINDQQLRSALFGGLVATVSAATAFYFSSKGADQARADILKTATTLAQGGAPPTTFSASSPPAAVAGQDYSYLFVADGTPPLTYSLGSGRLPDGVTLELDGTLHGTAAAPGTSPFSVIAKNALGSHSTDPLEFVVTDAPAA
jgi:putative Ig domain-containing protein